MNTTTIKSETQKQIADKMRKIRKDFYKFRHKEYDGRNINRMFEVYLKYSKQLKMTSNDFTDLCYYHTNIDLADVNRLWYKIRGSRCVKLQDFDMFVEKIKQLINIERAEKIKQNRMINIKSNVKVKVDNIDIKPIIRQCDTGFIAEFEYDGQMYNAYGSTQERAISILNKHILKGKMNDFDLIGNDYVELYEYVDSVVGVNK